MTLIIAFSARIAGDAVAALALVPGLTCKAIELTCGRVATFRSPRPPPVECGAVAQWQWKLENCAGVALCAPPFSTWSTAFERHSVLRARRQLSNRPRRRGANIGSTPFLWR